MADTKVVPFPNLRTVAPPNPFRVVTNLPAGAGVDFASHFCLLFQRELADRFHPAKEKDHGIR